MVRCVMSKRVLVVHAHPAPDRSEINVTLAQAARAVEGVSVVDLYATYPQFMIDVAREKERLVAHDVIILQHPFYWYSAPAIVKEWIDVTFEYGFAYGEHGRALEGKAMMNAISAGAERSAYRTEGFNRYSVRTLLKPFEQTAVLCRMQYLAPLVLFAARTAMKDGRVTPHVQEWTAMLAAFRDNRVDWDKAAQAERFSLNDAQRAEA